jgi:hypothetical protein
MFSSVFVFHFLVNFEITIDQIQGRFSSTICDPGTGLAIQESFPHAGATHLGCEVQCCFPLEVS